MRVSERRTIARGRRRRAAPGRQPLEDAIHAAGGCAGFVRSQRRLEQARAGAGGGYTAATDYRANRHAPPERLSLQPRPWSNVRALDLTRVLAGPTCAKSLAEHGAEVLKISAAHLPDSGLADLDTGIGKRPPDWTSEMRAKEGCRTTGPRCRCVRQSYRPGALAGRGFLARGAREAAAPASCAPR